MFELIRDKGGLWSWQFRDAKGNVLCKSEHTHTRRGRSVAEIEAFRKHVPNASIVEVISKISETVQTGGLFDGH